MEKYLGCRSKVDELEEENNELKRTLGRREKQLDWYQDREEEFEEACKALSELQGYEQPGQGQGYGVGKL